VGFRAGLDWCGKSRPTGIPSPDRPARRQSLYRLRYPAHSYGFIPADIRLNFKHFCCTYRHNRPVRLILLDYITKYLWKHTHFEIFLHRICEIIAKSYHDLGCARISLPVTVCVCLSVYTGQRVSHRIRFS